MRTFALLLCICGIATFIACKSDDDDHTHPAAGSFPACEEIAEACHPLDTGSGKPHECHEDSEAATAEATCTAMKAECLAACQAPADGGGGDAKAD